MTIIGKKNRFEKIFVKNRFEKIFVKNTIFVGTT